MLEDDSPYVYKCEKCRDETPHSLEWVKVFTDLKKIEFGVKCLTIRRNKPCNTFQVVECRIEPKKE